MNKRERKKVEETIKRQEMEKKEEERLKRERREIEQRLLQEDYIRMAYLQRHMNTKEHKKMKFLEEMLRYKRAHYQFFKLYLTYDQNVYEKIREMQYYNRVIYHKDLMKEIAKIKYNQYTDSTKIYKSLSEAHSNNRLALSFKSELSGEIRRLKDTIDTSHRKKLIYRHYLDNRIQSQNEMKQLKDIEKDKENMRYLNQDLIIPDASIADVIETKMPNGLNEYNEEIDQANEEFNLERINEKNYERIKAIDRIEERKFYYS